MKTNRIEDENHLPEIISGLMQLGKFEVESGFFDDDEQYIKIADRAEGTTSDISMLELAVILHEGVNIKITKKMRGWLHFNGLHVKASTKFIKIPARPFVDLAMDTAEEIVHKTFEQAANQIVDSNGGAGLAEQAWHRVGTLITTAIKQSIVDLSEPQNHPFTKKRKGSANPLIDRGRFKDAAAYEVRSLGASPVKAG